MSKNPQHTYGEAWFARREKLLTSDHTLKGEGCISEAGLPKRMNKEKASRYYSDKLYAYWLTQLDESIPTRVRAKTLNVMLFRQK